MTEPKGKGSRAQTRPSPTSAKGESRTALHERPRFQLPSKLIRKPLGSLGSLKRADEEFELTQRI